MAAKAKESSDVKAKQKTPQVKIHRDEIVDRKGRKCPIQSWIPAKPKLQIYLLHGLAEHIECYSAFAEALCEQDIAVHAVDLIGHGNAGGVRGHIYHFLEFVDLAELFHQKNPFTIKNIPEFLMGHSTGGLIAGLYLTERKPKNISGVILNNPLLGFAPITGKPVKYLAKFLARKDPNRLIPKPLSHSALTRRPESLQFLREDPLRVRVISPRLYLQILEWSQILQEDANQLQAPLLIFLSHKDTVVYPHKTMQFFKNCGSEDKMMNIFGNAKHEMIQDVEVVNLLKVLNSWVKKRV